MGGGGGVWLSGLGCACLPYREEIEKKVRIDVELPTVFQSVKLFEQIRKRIYN